MTRVPCMSIPLVFALGATCSSSPAAAAQPGASIHYFKQERPLPLDTTRLAVQLAIEDAPRVSRLLKQLDARVDDLHALDRPGWFTVPVPAVLRDAQSIASLTSDIALANDVQFVSPVFLDDFGGPLIVTPDLLVGFDRSIAPGVTEAVLNALAPGEILDRDWAGMPRTYRLKSTSRSGFDVLAAANALAQRAEVVFAEPDMMFTGSGGLFPNDPGFANCWGLHNTGQFSGVPDTDMDGPEAWDVTIGDPSVIIVIIDTGVQQNHPDLHQISGADFTGEGGGGDPMNFCDNHGTAVAGCPSAIINNALGTIGIAPGCVVASARTFSSNTNPCNGSWNSVASMTVNALAWAQSIGARVTNNSNYYGFTSSAIAQKYADLRAAGIVHFSSAGNFASSTITYPANLPTVNAVAAIMPNGQLAGFSNFGVGLDFAAPGTTIWTTDRTGSAGYSNGDYEFVQGTSFASPYTAGVAALVISRNPLLDADGVEAVLQTSSTNLGLPGYDTTFGWGLPNAHMAVLLAGAGPPNDDCADATVVSNGTVQFNTVGATTDGPDESTDCAFAGSTQIDNDIWYRYQVPCSGKVTASMCGSSFDARMAVYAACPTGLGEVVACNDDFCGSSPQVSLVSPAGVEYFIRIGGAAGATGIGILTMSCTSPTNDSCLTAPSATVGSTPFYTVGATTDGPDEPADCDFNGDTHIQNDVWFKVGVSCTGTLEVSLCDADYDAKLAVYIGCPAGPGLPLGCGDNDCGLAPHVSIPVSGAAIYRIRIGGYQGAVGSGTMVVACIPALPCPADVNGDGQVNIADLLLVIANWGAPGPGNPADVNGDNSVNIADLLAVIAAWGACA